MADVFISYSSADREVVTKLASDLQRRGISVFFDQLIQPGDSWANSLAKAIEDARYLLAVVSPDYLSSKWTQEELNIGFLRETEGKARVIPVLVRPVELPGLLAAKTYADFTQGYDQGLSRLLPALQASPSEQTPNAPGSLRGDQSAVELVRLRDELREAVTLFKSTNPRPESSPVNHLTDSQRRCFVVMPFGDAALQVVFEDFVRPVIEVDCQLLCERGDDVFGSNVIMDDIRTSIDSADIVIADLTGKNANVFYEVGIAHTIGKPVLLMAQSIEDVPFDLRHRRVLLYEYSPRGCKKLERDLKQNVDAMLGKLSK